MLKLRNIFWSLIYILLTAPISLVHAVHTAGSGVHLESPLKNIGGIEVLIEKILNALVLILLPIAAVFIIYAGFLYVKAQGNSEALKKAHQALLWTLVGTAVILGAWLLAQIIGATIEQIRTG